ncbi:hypothetical protein RchiOBHm_Chr2g0112171 [Rosa chinensis]|uniref:Transmembrane protein n=1 Tax=Rosa chinensis TaxID=74649 RepID=A0A2P6RQ70_ROSCH|nr:hypothetical protein RchiOBHm_Chr2g0112171 [Rosa chinensis]
MYLSFGLFISVFFPSTVLGSFARSSSPFLALWVPFVPNFSFSGCFFLHPLHLVILSSAMIGYFAPRNFLSGVCSLLHWVMLQEAVYLSVPVSLVPYRISPNPFIWFLPVVVVLVTLFLVDLVQCGEGDVCINLWKFDGWNIEFDMGPSSTLSILSDLVDWLLCCGAAVSSFLSAVADRTVLVLFCFVVCLGLFGPCCWFSWEVLGLSVMTCFN